MAATVDFSGLLAELEADKELGERIREQAKELERAFRAIATLLNRVHSTPSTQLEGLVREAAPLFAAARGAVRPLADLIPTNQYYKWNDAWSMTLQRAAYAVALAYYLGTGRLVTKEQICQVLDIQPDEAHKFQLATEEYLHALVSMINELSRLAVNSVTLGDFGTPLRLSAFVKDVHAGFQLLNLKNDSLRKRFDSIKYDVKKIEEVVYDISLRGLGGSGPALGVGSEADEARTAYVLLLLSGGSA